MHLPSTRQSNRENILNGCRLDHKGECLMIVEVRSLVKSLGHEVSLVSSYEPEVLHSSHLSILLILSLGLKEKDQRDRGKDAPCRGVSPISIICR